MSQRRVMVLGAGGFIGGHLVKRLKSEGLWVRAVDLKRPEFDRSPADDFVLGDLRDPAVVDSLFDGRFHEVYQLAADMGGAGYVFTGDNDAAIMHNSAQINLNVLESCRRTQLADRVFYASSACIYPAHNQTDPDNPICSEDSAYPANPDSEYGWEKLFSERLYLAYQRNHGLTVRIARYHNIFGPFGTYEGGREKAPAALCRKVAAAAPNDSIDIWGPGTQTRSFLYVDECVEGTIRLMRSEHSGPVNIGSEEMISINDLALMIIALSGKPLAIRNVPGPIGVMGRNSDNRLLRQMLAWEPAMSLRSGIAPTLAWIAERLRGAEGGPAPFAPMLTETV